MRKTAEVIFPKHMAKKKIESSILKDVISIWHEVHGKGKKFFSPFLLWKQDFDTIEIVDFVDLWKILWSFIGIILGKLSCSSVWRYSFYQYRIVRSFIATKEIQLKEFDVRKLPFKSMYQNDFLFFFFFNPWIWPFFAQLFHLLVILACPGYLPSFWLRSVLSNTFW